MWFICYSLVPLAGMRITDIYGVNVWFILEKPFGICSEGLESYFVLISFSVSYIFSLLFWFGGYFILPRNNDNFNMQSLIIQTFWSLSQWTKNLESLFNFMSCISIKFLIMVSTVVLLICGASYNLLIYYLISFDLATFWSRW